MLYTDCQTGKTAAIALHVICSNHLFVIADFNNFTAVPAQCGWLLAICNFGHLQLSYTQD